MLEGLSDCVVCICTWYHGSILRGDKTFFDHLNEVFNCGEWVNSQDVWLLYPDKNPFPWGFTEEHMQYASF